MADKEFMNKKKEIIQSIYPLFTEKGLKGITVKEICKAANIALGTFYHYFPSKETIVEDLFQMMDFEFEERISWILENNSSKERLNRFVQCFAEYVDQWGFHTNTLVMKTVLENSPSDSNSRKIYAILKDIMEEGQKSGELLPSYTVEEMSQFLWIYIRGTLFEWTKHSQGYPLVERMKEGASFIIHSISKNE